MRVHLPKNKRVRFFLMFPAALVAGFVFGFLQDLVGFITGVQ